MNDASIFKPIRDLVINGCVNSCEEYVNLTIYTIDSDWLPKYKCHVNNQSELLIERQLQTDLGWLSFEAVFTLILNLVILLIGKIAAPVHSASAHLCQIAEFGKWLVYS